MVSFDPVLGLVSTSLTIPLFCDNITEGTEYFGLTFVAVTDETEDNPIEIIPVEPTQVIVAIKDSNGMHSHECIALLCYVYPVCTSECSLAMVFNYIKIVKILKIQELWYVTVIPG